MIIVVKKECEKNQYENLVDWIKELGLDVHVSEGHESTVLGLVGDTSKVDIDLISTLDIVEKVQKVVDEMKEDIEDYNEQETKKKEEEEKKAEEGE
jgi:3-deoxy-7-phosphoheptulonate synthase